MLSPGVRTRRKSKSVAPPHLHSNPKVRQAAPPAPWLSLATRRAAGVKVKRTDSGLRLLGSSPGSATPSPCLRTRASHMASPRPSFSLCHGIFPRVVEGPATGPGPGQSASPGRVAQGCGPGPPGEKLERPWSSRRHSPRQGEPPVSFENEAPGDGGCCQGSREPGRR